MAKLSLAELIATGVPASVPAAVRTLTATACHGRAAISVRIRRGIEETIIAVPLAVL
jgi:hypothetical protein